MHMRFRGYHHIHHHTMSYALDSFVGVCKICQNKWSLLSLLRRTKHADAPTNVYWAAKWECLSRPSTPQSKSFQIHIDGNNSKSLANTNKQCASFHAFCITTFGMLFHFCFFSPHFNIIIIISCSTKSRLSNWSLKYLAKICCG